MFKDPNSRVRESMQLVFTKFRETWSLRQTFRWFRDNGVELPISKWQNGKHVIVFQVPRQCFIGSVLHNPFYAGAYTWGRRPTQVLWREGALRKRQAAALPPEEARVFIRDHHEGYIDWATFEENQRMISRNNFRGESDQTAGVARSGKGLLAGLLRCGRCGRKLYVRYWGKSSTSARYLCSGDFGAGGGSYCIGFGGATVDRRFGDEILRVLSPLGIQASLQAVADLGSQHDQQRQALERQIEQLEYDAKRAFEQYNEVDARNRLVASELERRWNEKLQALDGARASLAELDSQRQPVSAEERHGLMELGERFADVWHHPTCPIELKKQIVRTLVEEILVNEDPPGRLSFIVHWKGGCHTALEMEKANPKTVNRTAEEDLDVIRKMASRYGDNVIAGVLKRLGRQTGKGNPWTQTAVKSARHSHKIEGQRRSPDDPEILTLQGAAKYTGTSDTTIKKLVDAGILSMRQVVPFAPWEIRRADLDREPVRSVIEHLRRTGRLVLGGTSRTQRELF